MATEDLTGSAKFIDDLVATNPVSSDSVSDGDDHIRGVKNVLKNTLPNITGAVTPTHTELNYVDGVTSAIQTQIDGKVDDAQVLTNVPSGALFTDTTYSHPTGDGNLHVPATSTTNNAKVLTAGATAGALTWETPASGGGGGGGWTEISSGTITSNTSALEFTGISTSYNSIRLYMTDIDYNEAINYMVIQSSSSGSFTSLTTWDARTTWGAYDNTTMQSGYGTNTNSPHFTGGNHATINHSTFKKWTFIMDFHDIQGVPFMSYQGIEPLDGARVSHAMAHGCSGRLDSFRLVSAYGSGRYFTAGTYILYGME